MGCNQLASNGIEAIKKMGLPEFDLILPNLQVPEMDGYQVANIMRFDPKLFRIPFIAISAETISNVREQAVNAGMDDFVSSLSTQMI